MVIPCFCHGIMVVVVKINQI